MRRAPLLPVALALMAGIAAQHWLAAMPTAAWWWLAAATAAAAGVVLALRRRLDSWLPLAALLLCTLAVGGTLGRRHDPLHNHRHWSYQVATGIRQEFVALRLTTTPAKTTSRSHKAQAEVLSIGGKHTEGSMYVYFKNEPATARLRYGDRLLVHTYIDGNRRSIYTTADHYLVTSRDSTSLRARSEALRLRLLRRMQRGPLEPDEATIAEAMTLGWRADIGAETRDAFRDAGIAHLLAVSGLHVGLVAALLGLLCFAIPRHRTGRIIRGAVQLAGVWLFALITGLAPSTVRAALMFSLFIVANVSGRRTPKLNLLAATAIATLAARPMLLFDVGWQLSYSAVGGILLARPVIGLYRSRLWQASAVSVSATLATLPVTLAVFRRLHPWFLIANVVIVPLSGLILALALAYMALPCQFTATLLHLPLAATMWLTRHVAALPHASVAVAHVGPWFTAAVTLLAVALLCLPSLFIRDEK